MAESLQILDQYKLNFNAGGLHVLNVSLAVIMFGVALSLSAKNFREILRDPKAYFLGLISQFLFLPALTFALILILRPSETVALGMILVASCPGGNVSNFISSLAKGNVELSVTMTGTSTLTAVLATPINFGFWGSLYVQQSAAMQPITINFLQMFETVVLILGLPLVLGMQFSRFFPKVTSFIKKPIKIISIVFFAGFIIVAFSNNLSIFLKVIHLIFLLVLAHNALAILTGYFLSRLARLDLKDRITIAVETGIQNSGLALVLIFNPKIFPPHLEIGGMAIVAAWWGVWHLISGILFATFWNLKKR